MERNRHRIRTEWYSKGGGRDVVDGSYDGWGVAVVRAARWLPAIALLCAITVAVKAAGGQSDGEAFGATKAEFQALRFSEESPAAFSRDTSSRLSVTVRTAQLPSVGIGPEGRAIAGDEGEGANRELLPDLGDGELQHSRSQHGRRARSGTARTSGPPDLRMTELTVDTSLESRIGPTDELDPSLDGVRYVLTFDTDYLNPDLRFSYASRPLGYRHNPLYFEDVALERYGVACGVADPLISAAHFYGNVLILPYKLTVNHPNHAIATYGPRRDFWRAGCFDPHGFPSDSQWRSVLGVSVETLVVSALVLGL